LSDEEYIKKIREHEVDGHNPLDPQCPSCILSSSRSRPHRKATMPRVLFSTGELSVDIAGPFSGTPYALIGHFRWETDPTKDGVQGDARKDGVQGDAREEEAQGDASKSDADADKGADDQPEAAAIEGDRGGEEKDLEEAEQGLADGSTLDGNKSFRIFVEPLKTKSAKANVVT
jgi:hypothetical protein